MGYSPWGCKESVMTERLTLSLHRFKSCGKGSSVLQGQDTQNSAGDPEKGLQTAAVKQREYRRHHSPTRKLHI